jgi:hypothetical protein
MLQSPYPAERAVAGEKVTAFLRAHNTSWEALLLPKPRVVLSPNTELQQKLALLRSSVHLLNAWEKDFVRGLHRFPRLSERQLATIDRITLNLQRRAA